MQIINDTSCSWINDLTPRSEIKTISNDFNITFIKIGMLSNLEIIKK